MSVLVGELDLTSTSFFMRPIFAGEQHTKQWTAGSREMLSPPGGLVQYGDGKVFSIKER